MLRILVLAVLAAALLAGAAQGASAWRPGEAYRVTEQDAETSLERTMDHVYCTGVARFGHSGEWPDADYHVLDCSIERNDTYCPGARFEAVKGGQPGYFRLRLMKLGSCY